MLYRDSNGYPLDQTLDGGDSCVRAGILSMCREQYRSHHYVFEKQGMRHPSQVPWNNRKNFSRDQLLLLLAGNIPTGFTHYNKDLFYSHLKRFFFAQNFERDHVGTTKKPWPHKVDGKWRYFDFADPLLPNHIGCLIIAGRIVWAYPALVLCYPWHLLSIYLHSLGKHHEENQMIAECYIYGTLRLYRSWHKNWLSISREYWAKRNEIEYHNMLVKLVEDT